MSRYRSPRPLLPIAIASILTISLLPATPAAAAPVGFGISGLAGTSGNSPTTLAWGPDGKLYVGHFNGTIRVYTVTRDGKNDYRVTNTQTIDDVANIPNHNDNGAVNGSVDTRLLLGVAVTGTAQSPVIYATSSDPRIGGGSEGEDLNLDTNSGTLSRLTKSGGSWNHTVLVRGLPRSEENHGPNGIALSPNGNTLYWAYGGNTNKGGPSFKFANLPEYAYSAAILKVDLTAINSPPYDLPTLDDPSRANAGGQDVNDPFGGNDGANQAKITPGSPVQVHAPGFRNPYDVMIATVGNHAGKMYVPDNGPNSGWGNVPHGEGTNNCTNQSVNESETGANDALHLVTNGYYGGHANPTRGNKANTFHGESPIGADNPVECDFRSSKTNESTSISLLPNSSNGIAEYTTNNFGGTMQGDLVLASYQARKIVRISLNNAGTAVTLRDDNLATFQQPARPLDVTTMGAGQAFPGTIWIANLTQGIQVMEPNDYGGGGGGGGCTGADNPNLDEDDDGYSNADEIDNGTNPCSAASRPADNDNDGVSDLNDNDDDNDGAPDKSDPFAIDPQDGMSTDLPVTISWENDAPPPGGIANTGFTGLMTNGSTNYRKQYSENGMVVGGAAGVLTVGRVPYGDAFQRNDSQRFGFQFGVDAPGSGTFTATTRIVAPFDGMNPEKSQSMGLFIGNGSQSHYVKLAIQGNRGGRFNFIKEQGNAIKARFNKRTQMPGPDFVDLFLTVNTNQGRARASYVITNNGSSGPRTNVGRAVSIPAKWYGSPQALAVGIISTSRGPGRRFPASWDFIEIAQGNG
jgi:hypothetical protein